VNGWMQDNYDVQFVKQVYESLVVTYQELKSDSIVSEGSVRIPYHTNDIYKRTAKLLGLMDDFRVSARLAVVSTIRFFNRKSSSHSRCDCIPVKPCLLNVLPCLIKCLFL
jgi:hypothetical protein